MMASGLAGAGIGVGVGVVGSGEGLRFRDLVTGETGAGGAKGAAEWTDVAVATFLDCFAEKYAAVKHKNLRGKDWKEVVDNLNKRCVPEGGPFFEYKQCRNKLDGLKKRFRQEKESLNANSQPSKWQWFSRMCELKGKRAPRVNSSAGVGAGVGVVGGIAPIGGVGGIVPGIVVPLEKSELDLTEGADNTSDSKEQPDGTDGLPGGLPGDLPDGVGTPFCSQNEADTASPRSKPRAGVGKKTRKRRRSHLHTPCAPELMPVGPNKQPFLWPGAILPVPMLEAMDMALVLLLTLVCSTLVRAVVFLGNREFMPTLIHRLSAWVENPRLFLPNLNARSQELSGHRSPAIATHAHGTIASSAMSENNVSDAGNTLTKKRNRLKPRTVPWVGTVDRVQLWAGDAAQRRPVATDRTYKLKIKRSGEEDFDDLFHLTGDTVQDLIDSFKSVYWEEENTQVRVQLKDKVSDAWVTVAPSVSLSQYGIEAQIIIKPQGSRVLGYPAIPLTGYFLSLSALIFLRFGADGFARCLTPRCNDEVLTLLLLGEEQTCNGVEQDML
ncbi:hypothetical protein AXG93_2584s1570 [Marchantia polymorpha subsp. ruderalis]|uniref:Myb/SANT-like DNA-binding domain-containing protein n=1 Tax=Marchantia polymorpha subsp. ruderalis TaxID=1480154 RepID=A0A176VI47_MARPO|nr:hypothetical protein AXG93_2584s1570 [Marchantia polymorpha subsp. ruderalis]